MNKVYKIIWSRTKNCYVVASELAKSHTKGASTGRSSTVLKGSALATAVLATVAVSALGVQTVQAEASTVAGQAGIAITNKGSNATADTTTTIAIGFGTNVSGARSIGIGDTVTVKNGGSSVAVGANAQALGDRTVAIGASATANGPWSSSFGTASHTTGNRATSLGNGATAQGQGATALGALSYARATGALAIGTSVFSIPDATNPAQVSTVQETKADKQYATAIGSGAQATGDRAIAMGYTAKAQAPDTIVIGNNARTGSIMLTAEGSDTPVELLSSSAISIGKDAYSIGKQTIAMGELANASGNGSVSIGHTASSVNGGAAVGAGARALKDLATAFGPNARALADRGMAIGASAEAGGEWSAAVGVSSRASKNRAVAVGTNTTASGLGATSLGTAANASGDGAIALGAPTITVTEESTATTTQKVTVTDITTASGKNSFAAGTGATAAMADSIVLGREAQAVLADGKTGGSSIVIGTKAKADSSESIVIGGGNDRVGYAEATGGQSIAIGAASKAIGEQSVVIGANVRTYGNSNVGIGGDDIRPAYSTSVSTAEGTTTLKDALEGLGKTLSGVGAYNADTSGGQASVFVGTNAYAKGSGSLALGTSANAANFLSAAIGTGAEATGDYSQALGVAAKTSRKNAIAVGTAAKAYAANSVVVGNKASVLGYKSTVTNADSTTTEVDAESSSAIAIGDSASATNTYATAIGRSAAATGYTSLAIGDKATATGKGGIAIGSTASSAELATAVGPNTIASGGQSVAVGMGAQATGGMGIAVGGAARATGDRSVVVGQSAQGTNSFATAVGVWSQATGKSAISVGAVSRATGNRAISIGGSEPIIGSDGKETMTGATSTVARGADSIAIGTNSLAGYDKALAIGSNNVANAEGAIAIGIDNNAGSRDTAPGASGAYSVVVGLRNTSTGENDLIFGRDNTIKGGDSYAFGASNIVYSNTSGALGAKNIVKSPMAYTIGYQNSNISESYSYILGANNTASKFGDSVIGIDNRAGSNRNFIAGSDNAIGSQANNSLAIGYGSRVGTTGQVVNTVDSTTGDLTLTFAADVSAINSMAIGTNAKVNADNSIALGTSSAVASNDSIAVGTKARASESSTIAIGNSAVATQANSVALGSNAVTDAVVSTPSATIAGKTVDFAGGSAVGTVSVGKTGATTRTAGDGAEYRTITNVAAGRIAADSTDAINGSQLYAVNDALTDLAQSGAGSVTYVDGDGNPVVKIGDKYYPAGTTVDDKGNPVQADGTTPATEVTTPVSAATTTPNSGLGLPTGTNGDGSTDPMTGKTSAIDAGKAKTVVAGNGKDGDPGKDGLLGASGADLSKLATVGDLQAVAQAGLDFTGDTENVTVHRPLSNTLAITGGADVTKLTDNNIGVVANDDTGLAIKLAKDIVLPDGSVAAVPYKTDDKGNVVDADGNPLTQQPDGTFQDASGKTATPDLDTDKAVKLTDKGLDNGGNKITNVGAGTDPTDAVNYQQYKDLKDAVNGLDGNNGCKLVDGKGNEVVKIGDKYYPDGTKVNDKGEAVDNDGKPATPIDTTQNPISSVTEAPNSGLGLPAGTNGDGSTDPTTGKTPAIDADTAKTVVGGKDGKDGLLGMNGADLSKLATVGDLQAVAQAGLDFTGDTEGVTVHRPLSKTLAVTGGADVTKLTDNNIGVVANADTGLAIKLAKDIVLPNGSVAAVPYKTDANGNVVDADGNPLTAQPDGTFQDASGKIAKPSLDTDKAVKLTDKGLDNGGNKITNVGAGTDPTDAVNFQQYQDLKDAVNGLDGNSGSKLVDGKGNEVVKIGDKYYPDGTKVNDKGEAVDNDGKPATPIDTTQNPISSVTEAPNSGLGLPLGNDAKAITPENGSDGKPGATELVGGKDDGNGNKTGGLLQASGTDLSKVATVGDLQAVAQAGLNFTGDSVDDKGEKVNVHRPLSDTLAITGGADVTKLTDNNIGVVADQTEGLTIKLAKDIDLADGSVTTKGYQDADGNPLVKGEDGKYYPEGALDNLTYDPDKKAYVDENGETPADLQEVPLAKENEAVYDGNGTTVTVKDPEGNEVGKTTVGSDGLTVQGKDGEDGKTVVGKDGITITPAKDATNPDGSAKNPVSLTDKGLDNGGNPISNVGPGTKPTDAATLGQIEDLADKLAGANGVTKVDEDGDKVLSNGDKDYKVDENGSPVDKDGNLLVKGDDGKYYPADATKDDQGNMVVPDGNGGTKPAEEAPSSATGDSTIVSDADKSGLDLPLGDNATAIDEKTAKDVVGGKDGKDGLLGMNGADLSKLATVGDLQALAQAGLDFDGDTGSYVHRPLSKKLTVYGEADTANLTAGNIGVVANGKDSLALKLAKDINLPNGSVTTTNYKTDGNGQVVDATGAPLTQGDDGKWYKADDLKDLTYDPVKNQYVDANGQAATPTEGTPVETGRAIYDGNGATMTKPAVDSEGNPVVDSDGNPVNVTNKVTADGVDVTDKDGNNTKVTGDGVMAVDKDGNTTTVKGDGVTAKDKDGNTTTVKGDGITVAGKEGEKAKTIVGKDGITITPENGNNVTLTDKGLNNGGNQVKGVGDATDDNDAVNYKQFKDLQNQLGGAGGVGMVDKDGNKVVKGDDGNYYQADENGNVKDADGDSLVKVGDDYYKADDLKKDDNGNIVKGDDGKPVSKDDETKPATPSTPAKAEDTAVTSNTDKSSLGRDLGDDAQAIGADDAKDLVAGKADENGNRSGGLLEAEGADLSKIATKGDLQALAQAGLDFVGDRGDDVHRPLSSTLSIKGNADEKATLTDGNIGVVTNKKGNGLDIKLNKDINLGDDGSIKLGNKVNLDGDTGLTVKGDDGKAANYGSDGSTIKDGKGNENKSTAGGNTITDGKGHVNTSTSTNNNLSDGNGNSNNSTATGNTITDGNGNKTETKAGDVTTSDGNGNSTSLTPSGTTVTDEAGNQTKVGPEGITIGDNKGNTYVTINQNGLAGKDGAPVDFGNGLNVPGALTVKPATTDKDGNTIAPIIDANGNRIQNVGAGVLPTDAVNVGQLNGVKHDLNNRMNAIGAHAAAMAALHPMEFANGEKTSIAAGIGTFQSKQAMAIGAFYRPNDDTMFSAAGSFGSGENMFNVGVSLRLGADGDENKYEQKYRKAPLSTIAVLDDKVSALEQENISLKDSVAASNAENESLKQEIAGQKAELQAQRQELEAQREQIKLLMERLGM
ncbi:ESPR-type extended signal peptide-containing protein [Veillonella sp. R32]|uniref:ESPR-type extended signal peptide-containing protein n=1 Tax=Veillonella sp. R32 TaxID=2021312 RepID=UPI0013898A2D|nr:ESPR-type extended signal peptide-containing protein [Veillonella sp. R32]